MRHYLLPETGYFYKANLHCHTYLSDGKMTPEQVKEAYTRRGYQIVAFTDHDVLLPHDALRDENFLPLNGCEVEVNKPGTGPWPTMTTMHMNCIAIEPDNLYQPCYHRERYLYANAVNQRHLLKVDESKPDFIREYSAEGVSCMMRDARESGFFVIYNHPGGSREWYPEYMGYHGMHAMEIANGATMRNGSYGYCPEVYDDMLRGGEHILITAGDDNHSLDNGTRRCEIGWAWTMIKAETLEYRAVMQALLAGHSYVSTGPEIHALWYEDDKVHIACSPADRIIMRVGNRRENRQALAEDGVLLAEATFDVHPEVDWFRICVVDERGRTADTNAYFLDALK